MKQFRVHKRFQNLNCALSKRLVQCCADSEELLPLLAIHVVYQYMHNAVSLKSLLTKCHFHIEEKVFFFFNMHRYRFIAQP